MRALSRGRARAVALLVVAMSLASLMPAQAAARYRRLPSMAVAYEVAKLPTGKILVAGTAPDGRLVVTRLKSDGTTDESFANDGFKTARLREGANEPVAIEVLPDNRILVVVAHFGEFMAMRLMPGGAYDDTFGGDGRRSDPLGACGAVTDAVVHPDNRKIYVSYFADGECDAGGVLRKNENGGADGSFKDALFDDYRISPQTLTVDGKGRLVVAGFGQFLVSRVMAGGSIDRSFGNDGYRNVRFLKNPAYWWGNDKDDQPGYAFPNSPTQVITDSKNRVVVVGTTSTGSADGSDTDMAIARLNSNGNLDTNFSGDGKKMVEFGSDADDFANGVAVQPNDALVVTGSTRGTGRDLAMVRLTDAGRVANQRKLDFGFNSHERGAAVTAATSAGAIIVGQDQERDGDKQSRGFVFRLAW